MQELDPEKQYTIAQWVIGGATFFGATIVAVWRLVRQGARESRHRGGGYDNGDALVQALANNRSLEQQIAENKFRAQVDEKIMAARQDIANAMSEQRRVFYERFEVISESMAEIKTQYQLIAQQLQTLNGRPRPHRE